MEIRERMTGRVLWRVDGETLAGADLSNANLCRADLSRADLTGANLWRANLLNADLSGANLSGAVLLGAILWGTDLAGVYWDALTRWPYDYLPAGRGPAPQQIGHKGGELRVPMPCPESRRGRAVSACSCSRCSRFLHSACILEREHARGLCAEAGGLRIRSASNRARAESLWARAQELAAAGSRRG